MNRLMRVTGKGTIRVKPDTTRLLITLDGTEKEYGEALKRGAKDTQTLQNILQRIGFEPEELKTLNLDVTPKWDSVYNGKTRKYDRAFLGYDFTHELKLEFPKDNTLLGKVLSVLATSSIKPSFKILYTVRDQEALKNELLGNAVSDACEKAKVLAKAAGVKLKEIQTIDYSWGEVRFETDIIAKPMALVDLEGQSDINMDIEPDDIERTDTVTVVWEIE